MERGELLETFAVFACYIGFNPARQLIEACRAAPAVIENFLPAPGDAPVVVEKAADLLARLQFLLPAIAWRWNRDNQCDDR